MIALFFIFFLCSLIVSTLFYKLWWTQIHIQNTLRSQGLKGPSYKFIRGNITEILSMRKEALATPLDIWQHDVFSRVNPHLYTWMNLYGNNFLIWIGYQPQIVVTEPELVKEILSNKEGKYKKIKPPEFARKLIGDGLVIAEGEKWSRLRKLSNYAFHGDSLKDMYPAMVASVESMLEKWGYQQANEIEISNEFKLLTSEVISRTAFGSSYLEGKHIFEMLTQLSVLLERNIFKIRLFGLEKIWRSKDDIESDKIERSLRDSIVSLVKKREDNVKTGQAENFGSDFFGALLKVHHDPDPKSRITVDDIVDECKVFYMAGHETTSGVLGWIAVLLSVYTEWQEKAREEVLQIFGQEKPTTEGIAKLKILTMVINEALRLYGAVVSFPRRVDRKTKLGKYEIPANVELNIPPLALHRNPEIWGQDAQIFNPHRFADGMAKATNGNSIGFLAFGAGPRVCVGLNFAAYEVKLTLSMILQRYKLTPSPNYKHAPFEFLTLRPQHGIQVILHSL